MDFAFISTFVDLIFGRTQITLN